MWFNKKKLLPEIPLPTIVDGRINGELVCEDCFKVLEDSGYVSPDSDLRGKTTIMEHGMIANVPTTVCKECWYKAFKKMHPNMEPAYYVK